MAEKTYIDALVQEVQKYLRKMFEVINVEVEGFDFNQDHWYALHTWTPEQEQEFKKWLTKEFMKDNKLVKKKAESMAQWFLLSWGWKTEDKDKQS